MWQNLHPNPTMSRGRCWMVCVLCIVLWLVFCRPLVWGHKVVIFAWVEGDTVYTQSKFSGGKKAKNSTVVVYDRKGNQLLEGKTDEKGEFSFKVPKKDGPQDCLEGVHGPHGGVEDTSRGDHGSGPCP